MWKGIVTKGKWRHYSQARGRKRSKREMGKGRPGWLSVVHVILDLGIMGSFKPHSGAKLT